MKTVIASRRSGVNELILPEQNRDDFETISEYIRQGFTVHFVEKFDQVADIVLTALRSEYHANE